MHFARDFGTRHGHPATVNHIAVATWPGFMECYKLFAIVHLRDIVQSSVAGTLLPM
jgi:hypothetical protein